MDNQSVLLSSYALEGMNDILSVQMREKRSKIKSLFPCPKIVKLYNSSMGGVDLLWTSVVPHIVWIESHLLDFTSIFSLIWWILHVSKVTSFITWSILINCLSLITRLLPQFHTIKARKGQYQCWDHLRGKTNLTRLIIMEVIYQITKRCGNNVHTVKWRVKKIEHSSSVWLVTFHYA